MQNCCFLIMVTCFTKNYFALTPKYFQCFDKANKKLIGKVKDESKW